MKKFFSVLLALLPLTAIAALPTHLGNDVIFGGYANPATSAQSLGSSTFGWSGHLAELFGLQVNDTSTGNVDALATSGKYQIRLTGAAPVVRGIAGGAIGKEIILINATGSDVSVKNASSSPSAANRILTGSGSDLTLPADAAFRFTYDSSTSRWRVAGGGGGTAFNAIAPITYNTTTKDLTCNTASSSQIGCVSAVDWSTFNNKEPAITPAASTTYYRGDKVFSDFNTAARAAFSATAPIQVSAGVISCITATGSVAGCLSAADWVTFNAKQAAGNYITALTGDGTASGPGSVAFTLATVNANVGSFTNASVTVNAKGLITAASSGVDATNASNISSGTLPAGRLPGLTGVVTAPPGSSTVAFSGVGALPAAQLPGLTGDATAPPGSSTVTFPTVNPNVGAFTSANITVNAKGQITAAANGSGGGFSNPMTGAGDLIVGGAAGAATRQAAGASGFELLSAGTGVVYGSPNNGGVNYLTNASFESGVAGWTTSSGTFTADATNYTDGVGSISASLSSQTGTLSQSLTPAQQLVGVNLQATCMVKTTLTTLQLCSLVAGSTVNCQPVPASGTWTPITATIGGVAASTSIGVQVNSTTSTTGSYNVDGCYLGRTNSVVSTVGYQDWTAYTPTIVGFGTTTNQLFYYRRIGDSAEIKGTWTSGTISGSQVSIPLPSGLVVDPSKVSASVNELLGFGAQGSTQSQTFTVIAPGSATALGMSLYNVSAVNPLILQNGTTIAGNSNNMSVHAWVPITGWGGTIQGYRADATPASYSGTMVGVGGGWSTTATGYANFSVATTSNTLTTNTNVTRNLTCIAEATKLPGVTCTLPRAGNYLISATATVSNASLSDVFVRLVDSAGVVIDGGQRFSTPATGDIMGAKLLGTYNAAAAGNVTFELQGATTNASNATSVAQNNQSPITWTIVELDAPMPAPYLVGLYPRTEVTVDSGNGYGSSSTKIRRFTNTRKNTGDITYADSSTLGGTFTIGTAGVYAINYHDKRSGSAETVCITVNDASLTTNCQSVTYANGMRAMAILDSGFPDQVSWAGNLSAGDIVRAHTDGAADSTDQTSMFTIVKVSN